MRSSHLPYVRTLENFDFSFQPSIKREQIDALALESSFRPTQSKRFIHGMPCGIRRRFATLFPVSEPSRPPCRVTC